MDAYVNGELLFKGTMSADVAAQYLLWIYALTFASSCTRPDSTSALGTELYTSISGVILTPYINIIVISQPQPRSCDPWVDSLQY